MTNTAMHMNSKERRKLAISELTLIILGVVGLAAVLWVAWFKPLDKDATVDSYATCVAAGNTIQESYPSVCITKTGQHFVKSDEKISKVPTGVEQPVQPAPTQQYLTIVQWDVRLPLPTAIADAYYTFNTTDNTAYMSTAALKVAAAKITGCTSGLHGLYIERLKPGDQKLDGTAWTELDLQSGSAVKAGTYYYREKDVIETACVVQGNKETVTEIHTIQTNLRTALKSLQPAP